MVASSWGRMRLMRRRLPQAKKGGKVVTAERDDDDAMGSYATAGETRYFEQTAYLIGPILQGPSRVIYACGPATRSIVALRRNWRPALG